MIIKSYEIQKNFLILLKYNMFLLYGENIGLKKDIKESVKKRASQKNEKIEILSLDEKDIFDNEENFYNSIYSDSLFSDKKIIIINDGTDKTAKYVEDILDKCPNNIFLIIFSDVLEKKSKLRNLFEINKKTACVPCYLDSDRDLENITINEFRKSKVNLSRESINLLIEKSNGDRNNLKNEIEKIKSFSFDKNKIDIEEIKSLINFSGEHKSDSLINECLCGNILQYKKILSEFYVNTINQIFLLRILGNKIQRLLNMKKKEDDYSNLDSLMNSSKPPIFWKEKPFVKKQLSIWTVNALKNAVQEINNTELMCKKKPQVGQTIFFNFFTKLCKEANSYS